MIIFSWWKKSEEAFSAIGADVLNEAEEGVPFFRNRLVQVMIALSVASFVASVLVMAIRIGRTDFPVIIHYNSYFGVDIFGAWWQVYILPLLSLFFLLIDLLLARKLYGLRERIASHMLLFAAFFAGLVSLIASLALATVNA
jgi:hypothetical protein